MNKFNVGDRVRFIYPAPRQGGGPRVDGLPRDHEYEIQFVNSSVVVSLRDPAYSELGWAVYSENLELADDADSYVPEDWS